jgi:hypothetical protein
MSKCNLLSCGFLALFLTVSCLGFAPVSDSRRTSRLNLALLPATVPLSPPPPAQEIIVQQQQLPSSTGTSTTVPFQVDLRSGSGTSIDSSSVLTSLKERRPPTEEEIAAKKRNFNLIFWGGGFVAPFLATIFYFGFRFWEK